MYEEIHIVTLMLPAGKASNGSHSPHVSRLCLTNEALLDTNDCAILNRFSNILVFHYYCLVGVVVQTFQ